MIDYNHWISPHSGAQYEFTEQLKSALDTDLPSKPHYCALLMDEMKIKSGLVFDKHHGTFTGFVNLGSVNDDIECALSGESNENCSLLHFISFRYLMVLIHTSTSNCVVIIL